MCLILLAWQGHPDYPLIVAANRDEFFVRPTAPAAFWEDRPDVLAGRDLEAGGTWLGIARNGRFAALTNYREGGVSRASAPSRGVLVGDFLIGAADGATYLDALAARSQAYNGFNLFVGDVLGEAPNLGYYANRAGPPRGLAPGIYGLSNHLLDTPWPKLSSARQAFIEALPTLPDQTAFFRLLADREIVADRHLPETGVPLEWERILSAVFVASPTYGTRASTVLSVRRDGQVSLIERSFGTGGAVLGEVREQFRVLPALPRGADTPIAKTL